MLFYFSFPQFWFHIKQYSAFESDYYEHKIVEINAENFLEEISDSTGKEWTDCSLGEETLLYNLNNEIEAVRINIENKNEKVGSIIVSTESNGRVIEYTIGNEDFLDIAQANIEEEQKIDKEDQTIYYIGETNYAIGESDTSFETGELYDISSREISETEREEYDLAEESSGGIPDSEDGELITNPRKYLSNIKTSKIKNVKNANITYKTTSDFKGYHDHCAPTAAVNLMLYWYNNGYAKLLSNNKKWSNVFQKMYNYMSTNCYGTKGTKDINLPSAYIKYFSEKSIKNDVKLHLGTSGGVEIMNEIDKGFPCHLILHSHKKYNDHSVFAIGYQLFYYNDINKPYDIFIRIADGWTSQPNRYVWGGCYGNWNYVTVHLK